MNRNLTIAFTGLFVAAAVAAGAHAQGKVSMNDFHFNAPADPLATAGFRGGVNVATGDVNGAATPTPPAGPGGIAAPGQEPAALLLPAVQKVREAASRSKTEQPRGIAAPTQPQAGLLVPAIQKAREAAR